MYPSSRVRGNDVTIFSYNGTTYVPLRALAETYGLGEVISVQSREEKSIMIFSAAEAQELERTSKYLKSTRYGRQNPIIARWNSEEQLVLWQAA